MGTKGELQTCPKGDKDCCFVEVRETRQKLQQLCTGCKDKNACVNLRDENFVGKPKWMNQCKPDYRLQYAGKYAGNQSVCRQCFSTCDVDTDDNKKMCFGGSSTATKMKFDMKLKTFQAQYDWNGFYKEDDSETAGVFGIPIRIATEGESTENVYMSSANLVNGGSNTGKSNFGTSVADDG